MIRFDLGAPSRLGEVEVSSMTIGLPALLLFVLVLAVPKI